MAQPTPHYRIRPADVNLNSSLLQCANLAFAGRFTVSVCVFRHFEGKHKVKVLSIALRDPGTFFSVEAVY
jgi:hypothetical protein